MRALVALLLFASTLFAAEPAAAAVTVTSADPVEMSRTFSDLAATASSDGSDDPVVVNPRRSRAGDADSDPGQGTDPLAARPPARAATTTGLNVPGIRFTRAIPPDTVGEIGPTQFVQMANHPKGSAVAIFDKTTGDKLGGGALAKLHDGGVCSARAHGDPIVLFDQLADRWVLTEFAFTSSFTGVCFYISSDSDALTSTWTRYTIETPKFPDYPKYAVMPDAYLMGANESGSTRPVYAFERAAMLAGTTAKIIRDSGAPALDGFGFQLLPPVDIDGATPPPAGTPGIFVRHVDDEIHDDLPNPVADFIEVWEYDVDFDAEIATFSKAQDVATSEFNSTLCGRFSFRCFRQKGTRQKLDPLREPVMHRPTLRVGITSQFLLGTFVTDFDNNDHGGVRWFVLERPAATTSGGWTLDQEGTIAVGGENRWMSSLAMNDDGDIGIGYSIGSAKMFPKMAVNGRLAGDAPNAMPQGEVIVAKSKAPQTIAERWGDYSAMSVDPADGETFWYTNEYLDRRGRWRTRIVSFTL